MNHKCCLACAGRPAAIGLLLVSLGGCGPRLTPEQLGTIVHGIPKVQGAEVPYPMPRLDEEPARR